MTEYWMMKRLQASFPEARSRLRRWKGTVQLILAPRLECRTENLRPFSEEARLDQHFGSREIESVFIESTRVIDGFGIPDGTGGVNPGDRRAIFYLIAALQPRSVLEVGTHIGASTLFIAAALDAFQRSHGLEARLTTVDIEDVNSPASRPWLRFGSTRSPREMLESINCAGFVRFVTNSASRFALECGEKFDFIFLDGDHTARTVYQEVPMALSLLNPNGVVLLHDYFPDLSPLWSGAPVIPGPYLATEKLRREGARIRVLPLGSLPWATKRDSRTTSLALLLRDD
jgi:predicted O-methyltransferase YrrM